jgi:uncharacterized protein
MRIFFARALSTLAVLFIAIGASAQSQPGIAGNWIGQIDYGKEWQRINLHLSQGTAGFEGTLDLPQQGRTGLALKSLTWDVGRLRIEWQGRSGLGIFEGNLTGNEIAGTFQQGTSTGSFRIVRVADAQPEAKSYGQIAGSYQLGPDEFIDIAPFSEDEDRPIFFNSKTRQTGVLYAVSDTEFFSGPSYGVMFPATTRVTFQRSPRADAISGVTWRESGRERVGRRVSPYREEEITFHNNDVTLKGTLTVPASPGRHPVLILVHGSGPERRPGGHWTHFFVRQGIAYFYFDKRGAGASTGDWNNATLADLAGDVVAAVQALKTNPAIDPRHIGVIGHSNGGWVAPLAAAQSSDVAFLIVKSGSALPVSENILYELEMDMRGLGSFSENDIVQARTLRDQLSRALLTNSGWDAVMKAIENSKNEKWFQYARVQWLPYVPPPLDSDKNSFLNGLRKQIDFDPAPTWDKVKCPTLVLLGELDANVPSKPSAKTIENALRRNGNKDFSVRLLPKANHGLFQAQTGYSVESARLTRYVPGYMDGIASWILKHLREPQLRKNSTP